MENSVEIPLPSCINDDTPQEIRDGIILFYRTLAQKVNFGIEGDLATDADLREAFAEFITMHHVLQRPKRVQSEDPENNVFYLEDHVSQLLRRLGV